MSNSFALPDTVELPSSIEVQTSIEHIVLQELIKTPVCHAALSYISATLYDIQKPIKSNVPWIDFGFKDVISFSIKLNYGLSNKHEEYILNTIHRAFDVTRHNASPEVQQMRDILFDPHDELMKHTLHRLLDSARKIINYELAQEEKRRKEQTRTLKIKQKGVKGTLTIYERQMAVTRRLSHTFTLDQLDQPDA